MIKAVIFDMDGTILNTLVDLANAVNYALKERGHRCNYDIDTIRMFFGSGIRVAFERTLAMERGCTVDDLEYIGMKDYVNLYSKEEDSIEIEELVKIYMSHYNVHCNDNTVAYDGIYDLLNQLKARKIKIAVVSNKPDKAVKLLCQELFNGMFDFCMGELPNLARKPERDMVDASIKALGVSTLESIYVGDSEIDLQTAANSDMSCVAVSWGFRGYDFLKKHGAVQIIKKPSELLNLAIFACH